MPEVVEGSTQTRVAEVAAAERAAAPDLARGVMLLVIALAHAPLFVERIGPGSSVADKTVEFFHLLFVNNHARSMFAFLFGYGLVQLAGRHAARSGDDWTSVRRLVRRRGWWLVVIGFGHVAVLAPIDIVAVYGVIAGTLVGMLRAKDTTLLRAAALTLVPSSVVAGVAMWYPFAHHISPYRAGSVAAGDANAWELLAGRLQGWPTTLVLGVVMVVPAVVLGVCAARRRVLEEPAKYRHTLVRVGVGSTALSLAGAVPAGLVQTGLWADPSGAALWFAAFAQPVTGFLGGIGATALVALATLTRGHQNGALTTALRALGRRSLSMYLFQSVAFVVVFYPYGLDLGKDLGLLGATVVAVVTWLLSLCAAAAMHRLGRRGPAEVLLRRLARTDTRRPGTTSPHRAP